MALQLSKYLITTNLTTGPSGYLYDFTVAAAYPTSEDRLPGWTVFKDADHKIVAMVRNDDAAAVERVAVEVTQEAG